MRSSVTTDTMLCVGGRNPGLTAWASQLAKPWFLCLHYNNPGLYHCLSCRGISEIMSLHRDEVRGRCMGSDVHSEKYWYEVWQFGTCASIIFKGKQIPICIGFSSHISIRDSQPWLFIEKVLQSLMPGPSLQRCRFICLRQGPQHW